ncbi:MAG: SRPBCC domain-containing protein ['Candidatus Kapabacteria' thiocyanatum]|uniref:Activator of Hsp90 ATPase homologue 1/2-like C-terminal domain-containing protein n=1 Tax=Candidatus Kapaibacterium thiocyanatum TaxID=1895771 RepID=A0A1M3L5T1_9BACT|nr:SRPBCC domain-containing protein ['Candidatus Kapabacteria' thiocyanatum]OJX60824.1 MAG: hypothetical protein BGO89_04470 ['Candidatus Kapabacteria' thiocyanatum]
MTDNTIELEVLLPAPAERIWTMITTPEDVTAWYAFGGADIDPQPGGRIRFRWDEHGVYHGIVEEARRPSRFSFRYAPFEADTVPGQGNSVIVSFQLSQRNGKTLLALSERGYHELLMSEVEKRDNFEISKGAWVNSLELLRKLVETA